MDQVINTGYNTMEIISDLGRDSFRGVEGRMGEEELKAANIDNCFEKFCNKKGAERWSTHSLMQDESRSLGDLPQPTRDVGFRGAEWLERAHTEHTHLRNTRPGINTPSLT